MKMYHAQNLGSHNQGQGHNQRSWVCCLQMVSFNNSKTAEMNLIKFYTKVKQDEKVCSAQKLGSHNKGKSHNQRVMHLSLPNGVSGITGKQLK